MLQQILLYHDWSKSETEFIWLGHPPQAMFSGILQLLWMQGVLQTLCSKSKKLVDAGKEEKVAGKIEQWQESEGS